MSVQVNISLSFISLFLHTHTHTHTRILSLSLSLSLSVFLSFMHKSHSHFLLSLIHTYRTHTHIYTPTYLHIYIYIHHSTKSFSPYFSFTNIDTCIHTQSYIQTFYLFIFFSLFLYHKHTLNHIYTGCSTKIKLFSLSLLHVLIYTFTGFVQLTIASTSI